VKLDAALFDKGRIRLEAVLRGGSRDDRSFPGEVVADEKGRAEAGVLTQGRIASLDAFVGQSVKKDDILAWVDAPEVARASADVVRARARSELANRKEARQHALEAEHATSPNAVEEAVAEAAVARADRIAAEGLLRSLGGGSGSRIGVKSPIDGVVSARHGVIGGSVGPDKPIFEIVKRGEGVVVARLPEGVSEPPAAGASVRVRPRGSADDRGEGCSATVRGDLGSIDLETRTRGFRVEPSGPCPWLVLGAFVRVDLGEGRAPKRADDPLVVPRDAIVDLKGATGVFVATAVPGELAFRGIRVERGRGEDVVVTEGLKEGERVAVVGAALVKSELLRAEIAE
jgi:RND family efflux transporter MFP subunit